MRYVLTKLCHLHIKCSQHTDCAAYSQNCLPLTVLQVCQYTRKIIAETEYSLTNTSQDIKHVRNPYVSSNPALHFPYQHTTTLTRQVHTPLSKSLLNRMKSHAQWLNDRSNGWVFKRRLKVVTEERLLGPAVTWTETIQTKYLVQH